IMASAFGAVSTSQSCHSPASPSSRIGALSEASPPSRRFMSITSWSVTPRRLAISFTWSGRRSLVQRRNLALRLAQIEEQLFLVRRGAHFHERPGTQDVLLYRRLDPPHCVCGETKALLGLESLHRLHQADIAFRDDLGDRQAVAAIAHGDLGHEPEMAGDKVMCRVAIVMFAPAFGEHVFLLGFQHREFADLGEVSGKTGFSIENR